MDRPAFADDGHMIVPVTQYQHKAVEDGKARYVVDQAYCPQGCAQRMAGTQVMIGRRTSLAHGAIVHGPCSLGERCFVGFGAVVFKATVGPNVFVAARAVVQEADVPADVFVPPSAAISQDTVGRLRTTTPHECRFMEEVVEANFKLAEGYLSLAKAKGIADERARSDIVAS